MPDKSKVVYTIMIIHDVIKITNRNYNGAIWMYYSTRVIAVSKNTNKLITT